MEKLLTMGETMAEEVPNRSKECADFMASKASRERAEIKIDDDDGDDSEKNDNPGDV